MKSLLLMAAACIGAGLFGYASPVNAQTRIWGTYYGGLLGDEINSVAVDRFGNIYVAGTTSSPNNISTPGSFDPTRSGETNGFLAKFSPTGARLWATYYGDAPYTSVNTLGVDQAGNAYIAGEVECGLALNMDTALAEDKSCQHIEAFLAKFSPNGQRLWGTYFGGESDDYAGKIVVTSAGDIYFSGSTLSTQGIASTPSPDNTHGGYFDTVLAKFNKDGKKLWARYLGGEGGEFNYDMACRASSTGSQEICYVVGSTTSFTGIATIISHDKTLASKDAYIARIQGSTGQTSWSTYYGDFGDETALGVAIDHTLNAYVSGWTTSNIGMATVNAHDVSYNGKRDMFLAKFSLSGARSAGTYIGSAHNDEGRRLAIDANNNLYLLGDIEGSAADMVTPGAFDTTFGGGTEDALLMKFTPSLARVWSTYYGGNASELSFFGAIAVSNNNHLFIAGSTSSPNGIATPNGHQPTKGSLFSDGYLVEFAE